MNLADLNPETRQLMLEELDLDVANGTLYRSPRLTDEAAVEWTNLLREAIEHGTVSSLTSTLEQPGRLREKELTQRGLRSVPVTAPGTLAEGEFNRFYMRGVCRYAIERNRSVEVYRAKNVSKPRPGSQEKLGTRPDPQELLTDLRANPGADTALGLPAGPNSGLSIRLV